MPYMRRMGTRISRSECADTREGTPGFVAAVKCLITAAPATATPGRPAAQGWQ
jgi:hypothetical protein